jgi:hypothetical protein
VDQFKVLDISSVFPMEIPQDAHDNVFFCQTRVENCTQVFLRFDVNRDKSDVTASFGMMDWSDVCRVFRQACSSLRFLCRVKYKIYVGRDKITLVQKEEQGAEVTL